MKNQMLKKTNLTIFSLLICLQGCTQISSLPIPKIDPSVSTSTKVLTVSTNNLELEIANQINQYRQSRNLTSIQLNSFLSEQARLYSERVARGETSFENTNFDAEIDDIRQRIPFENVKINLAYNQGYEDPATATVQNWLGSIPHRQNIEGNFDLMGIGVAKNESDQYYFTLMLLQQIPPISGATLREFEIEVFTQVNQYRQSRGLSALRLDERISQQSRLHSQGMAGGSATFSHDGFEQRIEAIARLINLQGAAENLAYNQGYDDPVKTAVEGWIKSPGHHKNMIGDFDLTGVGVARNEKGEYYLNQIFIKQ